MDEKRRAALADEITDRYARDEIPMDEFERLVARIHMATEPGELDAVAGELDMMGLPGDRRTGTSAGPGRNPASTPDGFIDDSEVQSCMAILSERRHSGSWLAKRNVAAFTVLATQIFDFRHVDLPPGPTTLEAFALLGSIEVIVPPWLPVRMEAMPLMGETKLKPGVSAAPSAGEPELVITGAALLGSISVKAR